MLIKSANYNENPTGVNLLENFQSSIEIVGLYIDYGIFLFYNKSFHYDEVLFVVDFGYGGDIRNHLGSGDVAVVLLLVVFFDG